MLTLVTARQHLTGFTVTANVELVDVDGRRLKFAVESHDGVDMISTGTHERFVIDKRKFNETIQQNKESFRLKEKISGLTESVTPVLLYPDFN